VVSLCLQVRLVFKSFSNVGYKLLTKEEIQKAVEEDEEEGNDDTQTHEVQKMNKRAFE